MQIIKKTTNSKAITVYVQFECLQIKEKEIKLI